MTRADRILVAVLALAIVLSLPLVSIASSHTPSDAVVKAPEGRTVLDLSKDGVFEIQGRQGVVRLSVSRGQVSALSADCPDQICVRSGAARPGRPIVCAPNGVSVTLSGSQEGGVDAVSR